MLITPEAQTEADVLESGIAEAYFAVHGRRILSARPAPEVDKERLVAEKTGQLGISNRLSVRRFPADELSPDRARARISEAMAAGWVAAACSKYARVVALSRTGNR